MPTRATLVRTTVLTLLCLLAVVCCRAEVSVRNGDFFIGFTDIEYSGGFQPKIERVYNSKTSFRGIFGMGWGTKYEAYLEIDPDGTVTVHEYGGGADNRFVPPHLTAANVETAVDKIVSAAQKENGFESPAAMKSYREHLVNDSQFRGQEWDEYLKLGLVKPAELPAGTVLTSNRFSHEVLVRTAAGYARHFDNGREEFFDERGRLTRILDANGNFVQLSYDVPGQIQIVDNYQRHITLFLNDLGLVQRIEGDGGQVAIYRYDARGALVYSKDANNNVNQYEYDSRFNLTAIRYSDGTSMEMTYYPREQYENIRSVKDRDGSLTTYTYWIDPSDHGHYRVTSTFHAPDEAKPEVSSYEYFEKSASGGARYTARMIADINGERTDTTYNDAGLPIDIVRDGMSTTFAYDASGHVIRKETPDDITELQYDPHSDKVTYVRHISKQDPKDVTWEKYTYDDRGNLLYAENNSGASVRLGYDGLGRITQLVRRDGSVLRFAYNVNSKPTQICLVQGSQSSCIDVTYDEHGGIQKVDSTGGTQVAMKVTRAFQELLDLIRPAGITLSF